MKPGEDRLDTRDRMVPLCVPKSPVELAIICSLLESEDIYHYVFNDFFGSLKVGPVIPLYNEKLVMVPRSSLDNAMTLLSASISYDELPDGRGYTFFEKLRMVLEVVFFNWIMPAAGRHRRNNAEESSIDDSRSDGIGGT